MEKSNALLWKLYAGVLGAVAAAATTRLITGVWRRTTGNEPPELDDPDASTREVLVWAVSSAASAAIAAVVVNRLAASSWRKLAGQPVPVKRRR